MSKLNSSSKLTPHADWLHLLFLAFAAVQADQCSKVCRCPIFWKVHAIHISERCRPSKVPKVLLANNQCSKGRRNPMHWKVHAIQFLKGADHPMCKRCCWPITNALRVVVANTLTGVCAIQYAERCRLSNLPKGAAVQYSRGVPNRWEVRPSNSLKGASHPIYERCRYPILWKVQTIQYPKGGAGQFKRAHTI